MSDPTETWRDVFAVSGMSTSAQLRHVEQERDDAVSRAERMRGFWHECSRHRDEIQKALAASQTDLTAMQEQRDDARARLAEAWGQRDQARRDVRQLTAELGSALRALDERSGWQVARTDTGITCASCTARIVRGQAFQPLADAKGHYAHCACPEKEG